MDSGSHVLRPINIRSESTILPMPIMSSPLVVTHSDRDDIVVENPVNVGVELLVADTDEPIIELRLSQGIRKPAILDDYLVYLQELESYVIDSTDLVFQASHVKPSLF